MAPRVEAHVRPALLVWARETAGLAIEEAARKLAVTTDRLREWEDREGRLKPTVPQLRKAANVYKRPFAVFFLPSPPARPIPLHDFRRLDPDRAVGLSPELLLEMRRARRRRSVALELHRDLDEPVPELPLRATINTDADVLATDVRAWFGVTVEQQARWTTDYGALNGWLAIFEGHGILVFQTGDVTLEEMRGFSLNERTLPVIVLNAKDAPRGRVFTLMHEFIHLTLNRGGVCDPLRVARVARNADEQVEVFCNRVAGAVLVPADALLGDPRVAAARGMQWDENTLRLLSERFAVSREVILRRLLILRRTTEDFYEQKRQEYQRAAAARAPAGGGFAPPFRLAVRDNGRRYTRLVLDALEREEITPADVSDYLGVRLKHLDAVAAAIERAEARE